MNKKFLVLPLAATMLAASIVGCSKESSEPAGSTAPTSKPAESAAPATKKDPVTLKIRFFGTENGHYRNVDPAFREFEKRTKDTLNTTLDVIMDTACRLWYKATIMAVIGRRFRPICPVG